MVKDANVEAKEVAVEVLKRFRRCNEKTLELVDSLTASTAKLQDVNALYKEAAIAMQGDDPNTNRERLQIWIAKAKSVQEATSTSDQKNDGIQLPRKDWSSKILTDMKDQVDGVIKSYEELQKYIKLAKTKSSQEFWRTIKSQVGLSEVALTLVGLLCGGAALLLNCACARQPALLLIPTIIGGLFTLVTATWGTVKYRAARKHLDEICAKLSELDDEINSNRSQLVHTASAIFHVWNKFDILNDPTIDPKRLRTIGEELRSRCETMDRDFIFLKTEIEHLRQQVVDAHHYIVRSRRLRA